MLKAQTLTAEQQQFLVDIRKLSLNKRSSLEAFAKRAMMVRPAPTQRSSIPQSLDLGSFKLHVGLDN